MTAVKYLLAAALCLNVLRQAQAKARRKRPSGPLDPDPINIRHNVEQMWDHGYTSYMRHGYPRDELCPLSCTGRDTWGSAALTLVDSLDSLALFGNVTEFRRAVRIVLETVSFDLDKNVSVFEVNIRILGGLLSAHLQAKKLLADEFQGWSYNDELLNMSIDIGERLLVAFDTPTGLPYGTITLRDKVVPNGETMVTSLAGAGTHLLEFTVLSRLTGDSRFELAARGAMRALWGLRSRIGLYGNHIHIGSGKWTATDAGIGPNADSFYEYLFKGYMLVGRPEYLYMFDDAYRSVNRYLKSNDWYVDANMKTGSLTHPWFTALSAFWPGLQVLYGDINAASRTMHNFQNIWSLFGFVPEAYNLQTGKVVRRQSGYFLRPEMAESLMYLHAATKDPIWRLYGQEMIQSIEESTWVCS